MERIHPSVCVHVLSSCENRPRPFIESEWGGGVVSCV